MMEIWIGTFVGLAGLSAAIIGWFKQSVISNTRLIARIDELTSQQFKANDEIIILKTQHHDCERRNLLYEKELKEMLIRINHLEHGVGMGVGEPGVGIIITDLQGVIRVFSPSLTAFLRWLPEEIVNQPVIKLIPPDQLKAHMGAFRAFVSDDRRQSDSSRIILSEALTKTGSKVKVAISLNSWQVGKEGLITATIRERHAS